jgi:N4-gp56 family major capsid protein
MATTFYGTNAPEAVKLWSRKLAREVRKATYIDKFIGESADSLIQTKTDTQKSAGDRITITLRMLLTGDGVVGDSTLENNEESLQTYTDNLIINQLRHAVRSQGKMSEQRIPFQYREEAKDGLVQWWAERYDQTFFNHICGFTPANTQTTTAGGSPGTGGTGPAYYGGNSILAPSLNRQLWQNISAANTNDQSLGSTDIMNLSIIDRAVEKAKTAQPLIRPIMWKGDKFYVMFLHPYQVTDLRTNTSTGQWLDIQKAALTGGQIAYGSRIQDGLTTADGRPDNNVNPIFSGALGVYNGVILHEAFRVQQGVNSSTGASISTVRRAVLCGAQSCFIGFGRESSFKEMSWQEKLFDYGNQLGVKAGAIFGLKKAQFNSQDFGTIVASTYAASHS